MSAFSLVGADTRLGFSKAASVASSQLEDTLPRLEAPYDMLRTGLLIRAEALEEARDLSTQWGRFRLPRPLPLVRNVIAELNGPEVDDDLSMGVGRQEAASC